jgi:hypothetical protein
MTDKSNNYCILLLSSYTECLSHNIDVFGRDRGLIMCKYVKEILDNSICEKSIFNDINSKINNK